MEPWSRSTAVLCMMTMLSGGCARLVTSDRETVNRRNDSSWTIRKRPGSSSPIAAPPMVDSSNERVSPAAAGVVSVATASVQPAPVGGPRLRDRPSVVAALGSPPDKFGIPADLYGIDPLLVAHRREMESQASARHSAGGGLLVSGLLSVAVSAWALSTASRYSDSSNQSQRDAAGQAGFSGALCGILGLGSMIAGITLLGGSSNSAPIRTYYQETYVR
jgi:hypothetical protein